ncbi:MAG: VOC family protein [Micromonosporaceae bacterium]|nr:VOC family protein [Micromonosporaceae bacterium]
MDTVGVRYIVDDLAAAVAFYSDRLGFAVEMRAGTGFAVLSRGALRLMLNTPTGPGGASQPMADGSRPTPGGWNRIQLPVEDLTAEVAALRAAGAEFRSEIVTGRGGRQILLDDPSGNPVELFEPRRD